MTTGFVPSQTCVVCRHAMAMLTFGQVYSVAEVLDRGGRCFLRLDALPSFTFDSQLFEGANDLALDQLRQAAGWIEPNWAARELGQLRWDQRADDKRRVAETLRKHYEGLKAKGLMKKGRSDG